MNIRRGIQTLHAGQVTILTLVIAAAVGGLLSIRWTVEHTGRYAESQVWSAKMDLDSLRTLAAYSGLPTDHTPTLVYAVPLLTGASLTFCIDVSR